MTRALILAAVVGLTLTTAGCSGGAKEFAVGDCIQDELNQDGAAQAASCTDANSVTITKLVRNGGRVECPYYMPDGPQVIQDVTTGVSYCGHMSVSSLATKTPLTTGPSTSPLSTDAESPLRLNDVAIVTSQFAKGWDPAVVLTTTAASLPGTGIEAQLLSVGTGDAQTFQLLLDRSTVDSPFDAVQEELDGFTYTPIDISNAERILPAADQPISPFARDGGTMYFLPGIGDASKVKQLITTLTGLNATAYASTSTIERAGNVTIYVNEPMSQEARLSLLTELAQASGVSQSDVQVSSFKAVS